MMDSEGASAARLVPGGELHIVDFGSQSRLPRWFRETLRHWLLLFHVTPRDGLEGVLIAQARTLGAALTVERIFRDYALYARIKLNA